MVAAVQRKVSVVGHGWGLVGEAALIRLPSPRIVTPGWIQEILAVPDQW